MKKDGDENAMQVEVAQSVDNGSPRPSTQSSLSPLPMSRSTKAFCANAECQSAVGDFFNSWQKVTGTYYIPTLLGSYSILLQEHGRQKVCNSTGTELYGCTLQRLRCSGCQQNLGFNVVETPDDKQSFRGRDLFKLTCIDLLCEEAPNRFIAVKPQVDAEPLPVDISPIPATVPMEVDSRPPLSVPRHHFQHHDQHLHHSSPKHQDQSTRQSLPPPAARSPPAPLPSSAIPQRSPSNPPLPSPVALKPAQQHVQPSHKEVTTTMANRTRELLPVATSHSNMQLSVEPRTNGSAYPRSSQEVQLDAIERLQTQISQNSSALVQNSRNMRQHEETAQHQEASLRREFQTQFHHQNGELCRVDEAVGRLQQELRGIRESMDALAREVRHGGPVQPVSAQDSALELMAQQVAVVSHRTNEIDTLKITIEIMKNKIQRLEDVVVVAPAQTVGRPYASPHEPAAQSLQSSQAGAPHHLQRLHDKPAVPPVPSQRTQSFHSHGSPSIAVTPETSQRAEPPAPPQSWATVNAGTKRTHVNGLDSPQESMEPIPGSPKRLKLAPIEPHTYAIPAGQLASTYDYADSDSNAARVQSHPHTLPDAARGQSHPHTWSSQAQPTLPSQHTHAAYVPYSTQDAPSEDSWRPETQRITEVRTPRSRGRGGGPGSRGGRVRKSMASHVHQFGTPEWERETGQEVPQLTPDGYYMLTRPTRGIVRRGSGGGGGSSRGGRPPSSHSPHGRAMSLGLQGVSVGVGLTTGVDPYAHTKKTRTKPIRNADGVLIRKDGRPDMRSQSSAANLRKVHAKREEEGESPGLSFTPSNVRSSVASYDGQGAGTPSPTAQHFDLSASVEKRHNQVLHKMFPGGMEKSRQEYDYTRKVFEDGQDHTAHPRAQIHHNQIKREQAFTESPDNRDVDLDRLKDHADEESLTPGGQSNESAQDSQYRDAPNEEEQQQQPPTQVQG